MIKEYICKKIKPVYIEYEFIIPFQLELKN
jgi:hypothetical protein